MIRFSLTDDFVEAARRHYKRRYVREKHQEGFGSADGFADWCVDTLKKQDGRCTYCQTPIRLIQQIVDIVDSPNGNSNEVIFHELRRVRGNRVRGRHLEIERRNPLGGYTPDNCALVCYFCNNDKSYVYTESDYRKHFGPARQKHFEEIAERLALITAPLPIRQA